MSRLFLKVYVGIALVLALGTAGTLYILNVGLDTARRRALEERLVDSATYVRTRIQTDNLFDRQNELRRLSRAARMTFEIRSRSDLPESVSDRLNVEAGTFVEHDGSERPDGYVVYSSFDDGRVLVGRFGGGRRGDRPPRGFDRPGRRPGPPDSDGWPRFDRPPRPDGRGGLEWRDMRAVFLLSVIGIPILLVGPAIYLLIRPLDRRIHALSRVAERFGEGDLESRAETDRSGSLRELAVAFNRMADQIKRLIEGQNELLRAVSHELRTPLARLFFMLDDAQEATSSEEKDRSLARIQNTLTEMNDLVEELLTYVRLDRGTDDAGKERTNLGRILDEMPEVIADLTDEVSVEVSYTADSGLVIPRLFRRAVLNLMTNAARHARSRVAVSCLIDGEDLRIDVDDDGPGVPQGQRDRILEPFIRADESRNSSIGGVGLGLAIVSRIMAIHGGRIEVTDSDLGGARFSLIFPEAG